MVFSPFSVINSSVTVVKAPDSVSQTINLMAFISGTIRILFFFRLKITLYINFK